MLKVLTMMPRLLLLPVIVSLLVPACLIEAGSDKAVSAVGETRKEAGIPFVEACEQYGGDLGALGAWGRGDPDFLYVCFDYCVEEKQREDILVAVWDESLLKYSSPEVPPALGTDANTARLAQLAVFGYLVSRMDSLPPGWERMTERLDTYSLAAVEREAQEVALVWWSRRGQTVGARGLGDLLARGDGYIRGQSIRALARTDIGAKVLRDFIERSDGDPRLADSVEDARHVLEGMAPSGEP